MSSHPAGIRTEADMWQSFFDKIETEGFAYALTDFSSEICAIDPQMRNLVQIYNSSRDAIQFYLDDIKEELEHELVTV